MNRYAAAALVLTLVVLMGAFGCSTPVRPGSDVIDDREVDAGSARNVQRWPDGTVTTSSAQPFGATVAHDGVDLVSTGPQITYSLGAAGVLANSASDLNADLISIQFADPMSFDMPDGGVEVWSPPVSIEIRGLSSQNSPVIEATTEQVALWLPAIQSISPDQREVTIAQLERDGIIAQETAGALREAFGLAGSILSPGVDLILDEDSTDD